MNPHTWDIDTDWCTACGASYMAFVEEGAGCHGAENVAGISHLISRRTMAGWLRKPLPEPPKGA